MAFDDKDINDLLSAIYPHRISDRHDHNLNNLLNMENLAYSQSLKCENSYSDLFDIANDGFNNTLDHRPTENFEILSENVKNNRLSVASTGFSSNGSPPSAIKLLGSCQSITSSLDLLNDNNNYYDNFVGGSQSSTYDNWSSYNHSRDSLLNELTSFSRDNLSSLANNNVDNDINSGIGTIGNFWNFKSNGGMLSNSDYFDPSLFYSNNNNYVDNWTKDIVSLPSGASASPLSSQPDKGDAKLTEIVDACFELFNTGDYIDGCFAPLLSQAEMRDCLLYVIHSLLDISQEISIIKVYQKVFEKFNVDISMLDIPSVGSFLHEYGYCKPCVFANKKNKICENGSMCYFCHHVHKDVRQRAKNKKN